jgi:hypothetical protein
LRIRLGPLPEDLIVEKLAKLSGGKAAEPTELRLAARLARGSMARAESLLSRSGGGFRERRAVILGSFETLLRERGKPGAVAAALELAEQLDGREQVAEAIELLAASSRDLLAARSGVADARLLSPDRARSWVTIGEGVSAAQLLQGIAALAEASLALEGNGAPRLQLEAAALRLGGVA